MSASTLSSTLARSSGRSKLPSQGVFHTPARGISTSFSCHRDRASRRPRDPLDSDPNAVRHAILTGETFIVRPPPTAQSPYNLGWSRNTTVNPLSSSSSSTSSSSVPSTSSLLPPPLRPSRPSLNKDGRKLSQGEIAEIQSSRKSNPFQYTAAKLAKDYGVSIAYIQIVAPLPKEIRTAKEKEFDVRKANWGANKTMQRELRRERKTLW